MGKIFAIEHFNIRHYCITQQKSTFTENTKVSLNMQTFDNFCIFYSRILKKSVKMCAIMR